MKNNAPVKFNDVSRKRHLNINALMKDIYSVHNDEFSQMPDTQKTHYFLGNKTRLQDIEEFISEFKSFEEPRVDSPLF